MSVSNSNVGIHGPFFAQYVENKHEIEISLSEMDRLEIFMGELEEVLDYAGGITGLSTISGTIRLGYV